MAGVVVRCAAHAGRLCSRPVSFPTPFDRRPGPAPLHPVRTLRGPTGLVRRARGPGIKIWGHACILWIVANALSSGPITSGRLRASRCQPGRRPYHTTLCLQALSNSLWALASLRCRPGTRWLRAFVDASASQMPHAAPQVWEWCCSLAGQRQTIRAQAGRRVLLPRTPSPRAASTCCLQKPSLGSGARLAGHVASAAHVCLYVCVHVCGYAFVCMCECVSVGGCMCGCACAQARARWFVLARKGRPAPVWSMHTTHHAECLDNSLPWMVGPVPSRVCARQMKPCPWHHRLGFCRGSS